MGQALGAHPLLVIFALVAGAELYGIFGALLALPLLAMGREVVIFLHRRIQLEPWPRSGLRGRRTRRRRCPCASSPNHPRARERGRPADRLRGARPRASAAGRCSARSSSPCSPATASRCSGRTARARRRCSRCWRARPSRRRAACSGPPCSEIGVVPQRPALYRRLSARENLELFARLARVPEPEAEIAELAAVVALGDALDRPVERLSLGPGPARQRRDRPARQPARRAAGRAHGRARSRAPAGAVGDARARQRARRRRRVRDPERRGGAPRGRPRARARRRALPPTRARRRRSGARPGRVDEAGGHERAFVAFVERAQERRVSRFALLLRKDLRAARALAAADRRARALPARALAARRRRARRSGRAPARGLRERGLDPRRRARRRPLVRLRAHRARGRQARRARAHDARARAERARRRRRRRRDRRARAASCPTSRR